MTDAELQAIRDQNGLTDPASLAWWAEPRHRDGAKGQVAALLTEVYRLRVHVTHRRRHAHHDQTLPPDPAP